jgi:hypothetical protein
MAKPRIGEGSETLGAQQGVEQIAEQAERDGRAQDQIQHGGLLEPVAGVGVDHAAQEEARAERDEDDVEHCLDPIRSAACLCYGDTASVFSLWWKVYP